MPAHALLSASSISSALGLKARPAGINVLADAAHTAIIFFALITVTILCAELRAPTPQARYPAQKKHGVLDGTKQKFFVIARQ
jgi:hypothetical protein